MAKCSFCGDELKLGSGKLYAKREGTVFYFCSNKCEKNMLKMNRNPTETAWTEAYNKMKKVKLTAKGKAVEAKK